MGNQNNGIQISETKNLKQLSGNEKLPYQNGSFFGNIEVKQLISEFNVSENFSNGGISGGDRYSLSEALLKIPQSFQRIGIVVSFKNTDSIFERYEYLGGQFSSPSSWKKLNFNSNNGQVLPENADLGSLLVKKETSWGVAPPIASTQIDINNMLCPVWHNVLRTWVFLRASDIFSGGSGGKHEIIISINPGDVGKVTVEAQGDILNEVTSEDGSVITIKVQTFGSVKVILTPKAGFSIQRVNVDKVSQGIISEYIFSGVTENHTMFIWMQAETSANPIDWLERSDKPGIYYSSLQAAVDSIKREFPEKLTQDISITCIKENIKFKRDRNLWVMELSKWNKGSMYTLTIDGANKLNIDCGSVGGLCFDKVDNIVIKNINFTNASNYIESGSPEEVSAIAFLGNVERYSRNLFIENCTINGLSPINSLGLGRYAVLGKYVENVSVVNSNITKFDCIPLKFIDSKSAFIIKNHVNAEHSYGKIGHPALCTLTNSMIVVVEDNEFTGSTGEYFFYLTNVDYAHFKRNYFHDGAGEAIKCSGKTPIKEFLLESNLFVNMLMQPAVSWGFNYINFDCNVDKTILLNNTAYICSAWWQQWFLKAQNYTIKEYVSYNNIIIAAVSNSIPMRGISLGEVETIRSGNNIYQVPLNNEGNAIQGFFSTNSLRKKLSELQEMGIEVGSSLVNSGEKLLQIQNGGTSYKLLDVLSSQYQSNLEYVSQIDLEYKKVSQHGNTVGCFNLSGIQINEESPIIEGYEGKDIIENKLFSNALQYSTFAGNVLFIKHNSLKRTQFIKLSCIGTQHSQLILGRYGILQLMPVLNSDEEYSSDEIYSINIL